MVTDFDVVFTHRRKFVSVMDKDDNELFLVPEDEIPGCIHELVNSGDSKAMFELKKWIFDNYNGVLYDLLGED